ncbi:uncharacterized protein G2W53_031473 [Senna tora]|uniref:Uncharacterized protein n=1 Tax=Senna tora TaxID=362788 RepID=A0A834WHS7_9FABA|nr:uncharacterized protein G2W53_031473 [Senna tora]
MGPSLRECSERASPCDPYNSKKNNLGLIPQFGFVVLHSLPNQLVLSL